MVFNNGVLDQCNPRFTLQPGEELQFAKSFMDRAADAVFWVAPDAQFLYVNDAACCWAGYSREELLSMTMHDFDPYFSPKVWSEYWRTIKQQGSLTFESLDQTKEGWSFPVELTVTYLEYHGREYGCIFVRNITFRKQLEVALERTNESLEARLAERTAKLMDTNNQLCREIAERKRTESALRQSEARFRTLAETTNAIIFIKQGTQFCYVNPAAEAITGYKREELLAYPDISELIKERGQVHQQGISGFPQYEEIKQCSEIKILTKNGDERWLDCCVGVIEFEGKLAVLGTAIDITKRKQAEVEIRQALEQEKELSELRARFISIVSHEFRTPLNNISLSTSSLRRYNHQWTESEKLEYLYGIEADVEQLSSLLDETLFIGGAEAGKQKFSPRPLALAQFCRDIVAEMQLTDNGQHAFSFVSQGDCSSACVDKKLLQPILTNLLENAIKYSPTNSQIDLELTCRDGDVIFLLKDRGIGIPAADQEQLFEPFHRGRNVGDIQGTGLGLSVVKKFVDLHGGQISVASVVGVGTTFTVTLPLNPLVEREETISLISQ